MSGRVTSKVYLIYGIRCKSNGRIYIGRTTNLKCRLKCHFDQLKLNKHKNELLQNDFNEQGINNFEVYILEDDIPIQDRNKEYDYMHKYNTYDKKYGYNYNDKTNIPRLTLEIKKEMPPNLYEMQN